MEKLKEINNLIEHILKKDGKFIDVNTEEKYSRFISNDQIKEYRKMTQCFRHSTEENLEKRKEIKHNVEFLISYGLAIIAPLREN